MIPLIPAVLRIVGPILVTHALTRLANGDPASPVDKKDVEKVVAEVAAHPEVQSALAAKPWYRSKTVWAGLGVTVVSAAAVFGASVSAGDAEAVVGHINEIATGVLGLVAIWGRITARGPLK
jgi:hypothetical protein